MNFELLSYFLGILFALIRTAFTYIAFPIIRLIINHGKFGKKRAKKIALWNSIIVGAIYFILTAISGSDRAWSPLPAMLYYGINCAILTDRYVE